MIYFQTDRGTLHQGHILDVLGELPVVIEKGEGMMRKPILLSKNTVAFIQIFTKTDDLEDVMWGCWDFEKGYDCRKMWEGAAKEFMAQLKNKCAPRFFMTLQEEIAKHLTPNNEE